jgi:ATP-dependent DNA ligase
LDSLLLPQPVKFTPLQEDRLIPPAALFNDSPEVEVSTPKAFSLEPMLCEGAERPPEGREWRYELKLDGYRAIGRKAGRSSQLWSRNQKDFARRFPAIVKAIAELPDDTVLDGEIVALDKNGRPSFDLLQGFGRQAPLTVLYACGSLGNGRDAAAGV